MAFSIDPELFRPGAVSAETSAFNEQLRAVYKDLPPSYTRNPQESRDARESGQGIVGPLQLAPEAHGRDISFDGHIVPVRVFKREQPAGVYLHIHGGGWVLGRAHHQDPRLLAISQNANVTVVSVDYRLAPEHPFPAAPDDCETAARWLVANAEAEFGSSRLVIGGESAGAHLAVLTLLRMRDKHGFSGFLAANLVYGVYDLGMTPSCANWGETEFVLSTPTMRWFIESFVPEPSMRRDPSLSPLYADLCGLPPALFTIGTLDVLLDDTLFMASRWAAAGNETELLVCPGGPHGVNAFPTPMGMGANARVDAFLAAHLG